MASDENHGGSDCVKVAVRCRPPSQKEISAGEHSVVEMVEAFSGQDGQGQVTLVDPAGHEEPVKFAFDIVFGLSVLQSTIYETVGLPALNKTFEGYNGTIFAYGQTGSGKSFTMNGAAGDLRGITPRVNEELFQRIEQEQASSSRKFLVMCSYFEIYNEIIFDLLNPVSDRNKLGGGLQIKEHPVMGIYVKDLTEIVAEGTHKLEHMLESGIKNRAVSSTMMNATSSRSHSIFSIKVHQKDEEDASRNVFAKLNLVDLAGSERQKGTGATGQTLKEGANINKSLSALGNVINALVESANGKKVFIPYRNSKLTRVLQESLGGNSLCTMLATLSPAACNYEETMSTLRYANRAKAIKVSATKNEEASQISRLKAEVEELKKKLGTGAAGGAARAGLSQEEREAEKTNYEKQLREMEQMMNMNWGAKAKMSEEHEQKMKRLAEERRKAEQAVEEQRSKRLRFLQEQNDLELTIRGLIDFVLHLPTLSGAPPVLTGERPRQWLKVYRSLRMLFDELREHRMLVLTFKHGFDEDVKLWGEGIENDDTSIAVTGLNRCLPKLDKLRKGGEKLLQMETQGLGTASEFAESVRVALADLQRFQQSRLEEAEAAASPLEDADKTTGALEEVDRLLHIIEQQVQQKIEELDQLALLEMGQTCELVLHFTRRSATEEQQEIHADCSTLEAVILEPGLVSLPPPLPRKRLSEYTPDDVQDTPETTEPLLGMVIRWEAFCGGKRGRNILERLARPPPKFLWDITYVVKSSTGFPPELADWSEDREVRIAMFQKLADQVAHALGVGLDFDPADVLKGKEVHKTLRLLQLLAVAAAKSKQATAAGSEAAAAKAGVTRPQQLPMLLDAMMRCIMGAKRHMETQSGLGSFQAGGCHSMEARIDGVQHQLSEEARARLRQEEELAAAERDLQESEAELRRITGECDIIRQDSPSLDLDNASASMGHDGEQMLLQQQLDAFQGIDLSNPGSIQEENVTKLLQAQVEQVRMELGQSAAEVQHLEERQQDISGGLTEVNAETKALEADLQRQRLRCETEAELMGQSPEEQAVILQAHQQKLRSRAEALEAQLSQIQVEAEERKASMASLDTKRNDLQAAVEDTHLQMQIVQEERDGMREAMENLWNEKASLDEELENSMQAYTNLTESFAQSQDEKCEIESLVERKEQELSRLQRNGAHKSLDAKAAAIMQEATAVAS